MRLGVQAGGPVGAFWPVFAPRGAGGWTGSDALHRVQQLGGIGIGDAADSGGLVDSGAEAET